MYIHSFSEEIVADSAPHHLWNKRVGKIMFSPKETYTTEEARQLSIQQRHCVFHDEIPLITDDIYTFGGCMTQCRMNMARDKCGCVPHFYSQISKESSIVSKIFYPICSAQIFALYSTILNYSTLIFIG